MTFLPGHGEICPPHGRSTWRPADQPTTRRSTWTWKFRHGLLEKSLNNPRVHKFFARNSGAGNGCTNFMGTWKNAFFLQEKPMPIKFLVFFWGGGEYFGFWGGKCRFYFMGARTFLNCGLGAVLSCARLRVPPVALHVSRYTCRS